MLGPHSIVRNLKRHSFSLKFEVVSAHDKYWCNLTL